MTASFIYANGGGVAIEVTSVEVLTRDTYIKKNESDPDTQGNINFVSQLEETAKVVTMLSAGDLVDVVALTNGSKLYVMNSVGNTIASYEG